MLVRILFRRINPQQLSIALNALVVESLSAEAADAFCVNAWCFCNYWMEVSFIQLVSFDMCVVQAILLSSFFRILTALLQVAFESLLTEHPNEQTILVHLVRT